jgi:hypothetical protein
MAGQPLSRRSRLAVAPYPTWLTPHPLPAPKPSRKPNYNAVTMGTNSRVQRTAQAAPRKSWRDILNAELEAKAMPLGNIAAEERAA